MPEALDTLRDAYRARHGHAQAWKAAGGKVAGYFCDNLPEEVLLAGGILPVRISGDPAQGTASVARYIDAQFFGGRERFGYVRALQEEVLAGRYNYLDYLIVPHTRKPIQAIYSQLEHARAAHPELSLPELHFLDRTYTDGDASAAYNRAQVSALRRKVEQWIARSLDDAKISDAIALTNAVRAQFRLLSQHRSEGRVSGVEALEVIGASMFMPKVSFASALAAYLREVCERTPIAARPRIFVGGSPFDHPHFYQAIEDAGALVVAEDHCWGARCEDFPVDAGAEPMEALAKRYSHKPACSIALPLQRTVDLSLQRALASKADGAIFIVQRGDELQLWETPEEVRAFEAAGVATLHIAWAAYAPPVADEIKALIGAFVAARRRAHAY